MAELPNEDIQLVLAEKRTSLAGERNLLANDRTFLAWVRTGMAGVGGGIAILRLLVFERETHQMIAQFVGAALVLWSIAVFVLSLIGYYRSHPLKHGDYAESMWVVSILVMTLIVLSLLLLIITFREL